MYTKRAFYNQTNQFKGCKDKPPMRRGWKSEFSAAFTYPPANVRELDDKYELNLYAPGYEKEDFIIALIDDRLSISVKEKPSEEGEWRRQEFAHRAFVRQFELSEKIDKSKVY